MSALLAVIAIAAATLFTPLGVTVVSLVTGDCPGPGNGKAVVVINSGDTGEDVAQAMVDAGVVCKFSTVYKLIISKNPTFFPGSYQLKKQMTSKDAVDLLLDPASKLTKGVTIQEGWRINTVLKTVSDASGIPLSSLQTAAKDLVSIGIPATEVSAEGWLFPATYDIDPADKPAAILKKMVERTIQELDGQGVAVEDRHKVLTLASIIQKEARQTQDFFKVSRVFLNRMEAGMALQSDATVSYGSGGNTVTTTDAERASQNGYNTYINLGLPIGPISAPGSLAIQAAIKPAKGEWLYFCAINLKTGETVFSNTFAEHEVAVAKFQKWIQANPDWND